MDYYNDIKANINSINNLKAHNFLHMLGEPTSTYVAGLTPMDIKKIYSFDKTNYSGYGQTVAIILDNANPNIAHDLDVFNQQFNLPKADFTVVYPFGPSPFDPEVEVVIDTSLDVQWVHALAPRAKILLVVAKSMKFIDLGAAIDYAVIQGVQVVCMSWGAAEYSYELNYDYHFKYKKTVFVASSGDKGSSDTQYPAVSPNVLAAGGTKLNFNSHGKFVSETAWSGSGGCISQFEPIPSWQSTFGITNPNEKRGIPDVSFDADPSSGVAVYCSIPINGLSGWFTIGGTSFSAPAWAALLALAGQGVNGITNCSERLYAIAGKTSYTQPQQNFRDITQGSNGGFFATEGYDYVTGLGSPIADRIIKKLRNSINCGDIKNKFDD